MPDFDLEKIGGNWAHIWGEKGSNYKCMVTAFLTNEENDATTLGEAGLMISGLKKNHRMQGNMIEPKDYDLDQTIYVKFSDPTHKSVGVIRGVPLLELDHL